jgi:hypothetical protein
MGSSFSLTYVSILNEYSRFSAPYTFVQKAQTGLASADSVADSCASATKHGHVSVSPGREATSRHIGASVSLKAEDRKARHRLTSRCCASSDSRSWQ